jgi:nitrate/TMAO reductase-like tetraheme cytochrome c subunit
MTSRVTLARHPVALAGALLTTATAVNFVGLVLAELAGLVRNPYAGLVIYVLIPALFVLGLLLIPLGMWLEARKRRRDPSALRDWPVLDFRVPATRRMAILVGALTAANLIIIAVAALGGMRSMESPTFCGQTCHLPMHPHFTAWQDAPHSQVACTQCHVGEGARALVHYKLAGVRQLYHVLTDQIPKPIPGVADMRPALEVCGNCHWAGHDVGELLRVKHEYADDEANTETVTRLRMLVGAPNRPTSAGRAIHWHADPSVRIEYVYTDMERQTIPYVRSIDRNGPAKEYRTEGTTAEQISNGQRRIMDCIDCHNSAAHRIAPSAENAVDAAIATGGISRQLPFVRRESVRLVKAEYPTQEEGLQQIAMGLRAFYTGRGHFDEGELARAITALQGVYRRNVFPSMKVTFGVYPNNIGHLTFTGCFRCHDGSHAAADGSTISAECESCHIQVEPPDSQ